MQKAIMGMSFAAAALLAVVVWPAPVQTNRGSVELVGREMNAEIYGPQVPAGAVSGYMQPVIESVVLPQSGSGEEETLHVYASEDQKNYHMPTCRFAYASATRMTLYEAYYLGYKPGRCCNAPSYSPSITATSTAEAVAPDFAG